MKTKHKHTPGPWAVQFASNGHPYRIVRPAGDDKLPGSLGTTITRWGTFMVPSCAETLANARLIAASPEMFLLLEEVHEELSGYKGFDLLLQKINSLIIRINPE